MIDNQEMKQSDFIETVSSFEECIITQYISSAKYSSEIYQGTANTIRVVTAKDIDSSSNDYQVLLTFHRFGNDKSWPCDNMSSGGLFALIGSDGIIGRARTITEPGKIYDTHPDTGAQISGVKIPNFADVLNKLLNVHKSFMYYNFFAWDIVISSDGKFYVLEINRGCDLDSQMCTPFRNEKFGQYMRRNKLLDSR